MSVAEAKTLTPTVATDAADARRGELIELGRDIFFDASLSEPAGTSCASCHDPAKAFSGNNGATAGVPRGSRPGHLARRSTPSLLYLKYVPKFHHEVDDEDTTVPSPMGGLFDDGRVDTVAALVIQPLLNPDEMNGGDRASVAEKLLKAPYAGALRRVLGETREPDRVVESMGQAVEAFLTSDELAPFSSKFDDFVRGRAELSELERLGMKVFKDRSKGNCVACHLMNDGSGDPALSPFTDYGYDALGVPSNRELPAQRKPDLGLCMRGDDRLRPPNEPADCAKFRTPTLRNVALRDSYMHNGVFNSLRDAVAFYATRDTDPRRWFKSGVRFEDVPPQFRANVNVQIAPYNRRQGDPPAFNDHEVDAIVAFLQTLTDTRLPEAQASRSASAR